MRVDTTRAGPNIDAHGDPRIGVVLVTITQKKHIHHENSSVIQVPTDRIE